MTDPDPDKIPRMEPALREQGAAKRRKTFESPRARLAHYREFGSFLVCDGDREGALDGYEGHYYAIPRERGPKAATAFGLRFGPDLRKIGFLPPKSEDNHRARWARPKVEPVTGESWEIDVWSLRTDAEQRAHEAQMASHDSDPFGLGVI